MQNLPPSDRNLVLPYTRAGTSFAAPYTAGVLALWLQHKQAQEQDVDPNSVSHEAALKGLVATAKGVADSGNSEFMASVALMGAGGCTETADAAAGQVKVEGQGWWGGGEGRGGCLVTVGFGGEVDYRWGWWPQPSQLHTATSQFDGLCRTDGGTWVNWDSSRCLGVGGRFTYPLTGLMVFRKGVASMGGSWPLLSWWKGVGCSGPVLISQGAHHARQVNYY
jgi:hypothetical protein